MFARGLLREDCHNTQKLASRVKALFILTAVFLLALPAPSLAAGKLAFSGMEYDFGKVDPSTPMEQVFKFRNSGDANVLIKKIYSSCKCLSAFHNKKLFKPGEEGLILVRLQPEGMAGPFEGVLRIRTDARKKPYLLKLKASIQKLTEGGALPVISVSPMNINLGTMKMGQTAVYRVIIENKGDGDLFIRNIDAPNDSSGAPLYGKAIKKNKKVELSAIYRPVKIGKIEGVLILQSNDPKRRFIRIKLFGNVR